VQVFLTSARAKVNLITADQELDKYTNLYDTDVANRKYNASLQVMKDAEIYFALGLMYRYLGDAQAEKVINDTTDNSSESISIGLTSISTASGDKRNASTKLFDDRAKSYDALAMSILSAILPNGIPVSYSDETIGGSKFLSPTTGRRM
jgi:hypothetical protein